MQQFHEIKCLTIWEVGNCGEHRLLVVCALATILLIIIPAVAVLVIVSS